MGWQAIPDSKPQKSRSRFEWREILSLFQNRTFAFANGAILLGNLAMYVVLLAIPLMLSTRSGWTSFQTGPVLAVMSGATAVFGPLGGRLSDRMGRRLPSVAGLALLTLGLLPLAAGRGMMNLPLLLVCLALSGIGLGLSAVSLQASVLESAQTKQAGLAVGISSTSRYLGSIAGSSALAQVIGSGPIDLNKFQAVFGVVALAAAAAVLVSWGIGSSGKKSQD